MENVLRIAGVALTPLLTFLIFVLQEGRKRARLVKRAKTAGELIALTPHESPRYRELIEHYEQVVEAYLAVHRPRQPSMPRRPPSLYSSKASILGYAFVYMLGAASLAGLAWMVGSDPADRPGVIAWLMRGNPSSIPWLSWVLFLSSVLALALGLSTLVEIPRIYRYKRALAKRSRSISK